MTFSATQWMKCKRASVGTFTCLCMYALMYLCKYRHACTHSERFYALAYQVLGGYPTYQIHQARQAACQTAHSVNFKFTTSTNISGFKKFGLHSAKVVDYPAAFSINVCTCMTCAWVQAGRRSDVWNFRCKRNRDNWSLYDQSKKFLRRHGNPKWHALIRRNGNKDWTKDCQ